MQVSEVMHKGVSTINVDESIRRAAQLMKSEDVGAIPVMEQNQPIGFVTDRDIVISCVAEGHDVNDPISHAMTKSVLSIKENEDVNRASQLMAEKKVSRVLVVDKNEKPVGMVSLKDLSQEDEDLGGAVVSEVKEAR